MPETPTQNLATNVWSEPVKGLSGRLRVEFEDLRPGLRCALYLELRNHSMDPVAVTSQPRIHAKVFDSDGKPVATSGFAVSGPEPVPRWAEIPRDAYAGFRIDMQNVGVPIGEPGMALLAVGGKSWGLEVGVYVLQTTIACEREEDGPANQWFGELALPPVEVVVTAKMLAVK